jgi:dienelactone hydrolase
MRRRFVLPVVFGVALSLGFVPSGAGSLPVFPAGPRPGPAILYAPLAKPAILSNSNGWRAAPIMVGGAQAYRSGEFLYQDFVYDDYGANTTDGPLPPEPTPATTDVSFDGMTGDVVYPTNEAKYAFDAADLLEFRARLDHGRVRYRVTFNTMIDPKAAAVAIGIDRRPGGVSDWGYGIGSLGNLGLDDVIVASGDGARSATVAGVKATANAKTNQIEITTPLVPATGATWRHYLVVGLWNGSSFKQIAEEPTAEEPGGAHMTDAPPVFNAGFRFAEPLVKSDLHGTISHADASGGVRAPGAGNWREHAQALALAARDISTFHADIDFGKLAARRDDESGVPKTGFIVRLYASHLNLGEGVQATRPMLRGVIQPYGLYVPTTYMPSKPASLTLALHSLAAGYCQYAIFAPNMLYQLGEARNSFLITPAGRGPDGWYHDEAEIDLFEAWADAAARYNFDPSRTTISGYSMGGYGTFRFASLYPDLFARAFAVVGPADESITGGPSNGMVADLEDSENTLHILDNTRHVPILMWNGVNDELVPVAGVLNTERRLSDLAYFHRLDLFPGFDHFLLSLVDEWRPGMQWLGSSRVQRDPAHVTYRAMPEIDRPALGLRHDHAYWVSGIVVASGARSGLVDALSLSHPNVEPKLSAVLPAGAFPAPHLSFGMEPTGFTTTISTTNGLNVDLTDVSAVTFWVGRAGARAGRYVLNVTSSGPAKVTLAGSFGTVVVTIPAGTTTRTVTL